MPQNGSLWKFLLTVMMAIVMAAGGYLIAQQNEKFVEIKADLREMNREQARQSKQLDIILFRLSVLEQKQLQPRGDPY